MSTKLKPVEINDVDLAFGGSVMKILPPMSAIPDDFKRFNGNEWARWANKWFFSGLERYPVAKDGIDLNLAMRNLSTCMRSFEPKHEHKEAGVAYLASLWFSSPDGEPIAKATGEAAS